MAQQLHDFRFALRRMRRYDWDRWFDGEVWMLVPGEDFAIDLEHMRQAVYKAATVRGLRARTTAENGNLIIQAFRDRRAPSDPDEELV